MEIGERWTRGCLLGVFSFLLFSSMTQVQAPTTHTTHVNDTTTKPIEESSSTTTTTTKRATTATTSSSSSFSPTKHETTSSSSSNNQNSTTPTNSSSNSNNKATVIAVVIVVVVVIIIVVVVVVVCIRKRNMNTDSSSDTCPDQMPRVSVIDRRDTLRNDVIEMTSHPRTDDGNDVYVNGKQIRRDVSVGDATGDDVRGGSPQSIYVNGTGAVNWRSACALQPEAETIYSNEPDVNSSQWGGRHHPESANGAGSGVAEGFDPSSSSPPEIEDIYLNEPDMNSPQWHSRPDASSRESSTYLNPEDLKMIQLINRANLSIYHAS